MLVLCQTSSSYVDLSRSSDDELPPAYADEAESDAELAHRIRSAPFAFGSDPVLSHVAFVAKFKQASEYAAAYYF